MRADPNASPLAPCPTSSPPARVTVRAAARREAGRLHLAWLVDDPAGVIAVPAAAEPAARRDGLWAHTCLEAFVAAGDTPAYWELNVSPSGDWNAYRFAGYRDGMAPEERIVALLGFRATPRAGGGVAVEAAIDLARVEALDEASLRLGLCAVLETRDGARSYWALSHAGAVPDFHRRESFVLVV